MAKKKISDLAAFEVIFGYGHIRKTALGIEVRVKDLDSAKIEAQKVIDNNSLDLELVNVDIRLRSFEIREK